MMMLVVVSIIIITITVTTIRGMITIRGNSFRQSGIMIPLCSSAR